MPDDHAPHTTGAPAASLVDAADRAAAFAALRPALETLASQAGTDPRLSLDARRVCRCRLNTDPQAPGGFNSSSQHRRDFSMTASR
jgi:hypothetical protein